MAPLETGLLFVGIFLGVVCVAKVRDWPPFRITRKVRISSEWMSASDRENVIAFHAIKDAQQAKQRLVIRGTFGDLPALSRADSQVASRATQRMDELTGGN